MSVLTNAPWLGNVRELENIMHRAVLMSLDDVIHPEDIFPDFEQTINLGSVLSHADEKMGMVGRSVHDVEKELIIDTLSHCSGNRTHAANILGISIRTLRNKLKEYSIQNQIKKATILKGDLDQFCKKADETLDQMELKIKETRNLYEFNKNDSSYTKNKKTVNLKTLR